MCAVTSVCFSNLSVHWIEWKLSFMRIARHTWYLSSLWNCLDMQWHAGTRIISSRHLHQHHWKAAGKIQSAQRDWIKVRLSCSRHSMSVHLHHNSLFLTKEEDNAWMEKESFLQALQDSSNYKVFSDLPHLRSDLLGKQMMVLEDLLKDLWATVWVSSLAANEKLIISKHSQYVACDMQLLLWNHATFIWWHKALDRQALLRLFSYLAQEAKWGGQSEGAAISKQC